MTKIVLDTTKPAVVRWIDLLRDGTKDEVREGLLWIGLRLQQEGGDLPAEVRQWIGAALQAIGESRSSPDAALGLKNKRRIGVRETAEAQQMIDDLRGQGLSADDARDLVGRFNSRSETFNDQGAGTAGERFKKRISRRKPGTK